MAQPIDSFARLLAPMTPEEFHRDYLGRKPLHLRGDSEKFADVMSWSVLTDLINQSSIWSANSMALVMDGRPLAPQEYCATRPNRDGQPVMAPEIPRVRRWLGRGASLVLNEIDQLTPGLRRTARALEDGVGGKAQANLYCSWKAHPAFGSHFDTHDVFALHVAGEKTWNLYGQHFVDPIAHTRFKALPEGFDEKHKGPKTAEITLKPGDLLYIPRGLYHDALATGDAAIHIAFGVTYPIGIDLFTPLFERAVEEPAFRAALPRGPGPALDAHLADLGERFRALVTEPAFVEMIGAFAGGYRYERETVTLPADGNITGREFARMVSGVSVRTVRGSPCLVANGTAVPIPQGLDRGVAWIVGRETFTENELEAALPALAPAQRSDLLSNLIKMGVIEEL